MFQRNKVYSFIVLLCIAMTVLSACSSGSGSGSGKPSAEPSPSASAAAPAAGGDVPLIRFAWANAGYPSPFAFSASGPAGFLRNSFLFDTLTWKDDQGVIPWLAKSWTLSDDGLTYTFELEQGVTWHDGQPFTAEDVVFSFNYYKEHPFNWTGDISRIESVTASGDNQVQFKLNEAYAPFLSDLVGIVPIIPKHVWESVDNPIEYRGEDALVGTGPYKLKEYDEAGGQYSFVANDHYFKGHVKVKEIQYLSVDNNAMALKNNNVDGAMTYNYGDVQQLQKEGFDVIKSNPTGSAVRITFNLDHPQLKDKRLRQALAYALDRASMAQKLTGGDPMVGNAGVIPTDSPWYNPDVKQYNYDPAKAEAMLDELGYTKNANGVRDGLKLSVLVSSNSPESQVMQEMLKKVGIELNIQQVDSATFNAAMGENKYDMAITGHIGLSGDPDYLRQWFLGNASNTLAARGKAFANEQFQQLAESQMKELDPDKRKQTVFQMQDVLAEELPTLVLYHRPFYFVYKKDVYDGYFNTYGGIADGIPLWDNKAAFVDVQS
ncbi:ABC transporter substrate-binding protein [Paenibacillus protaetiae]|uniref:ABC transporter substrate-binding protein n=1 Tax=Paenibacillus protaetiae TaxID=2509456 RepID=A0A4P6FAC3_9BACL|nr:ABC transporter substrate-binding protein [Paenibacillus protaetiae]QAY67448.1 ABC transporter substrate-binding protein [Paenibacillus protaetiae]